VTGGEYLKWAPPSGEQLWLQVSPKGEGMGMNPHFAGKSSIPGGNRSPRRAKGPHSARRHVPRLGQSPAGAATGGDYPFCLRLS
jgi:hypothetical protein